MNLIYDGSTIYDAGGLAGGTGDPAQADPLTSASFFVDGSHVGTLSSHIWLDTRIMGVTGIPATGGSFATAGQGDTFGFDLIVTNSVPGWGLALNLNQISGFYSGGQIFIAGGGVISSVRSAPDLPFDLYLDTGQPINITFSSANLTNVTTSGGVLTGFSAAGTGSIHGTGGVVPEPASAALIFLGSIGLIASVRRSRRAISA